MKIPANLVIEHFLRSFGEPFSVQDFSVLLSHVGFDDSIEEAEFFLENNPYVFPLTDGFYITRSAAFTGRLFSFKPTKKEAAKGVFIAGCRTMPFTDPEMLSCGLTFRFKGIPISQEAVEFDSASALDFFQLCGEEFAVQFIGADPANSDLNLFETDFMLPSRVNVTGFSLKPLIKQGGFQYGDRLLCKVADWDAGIVDIVGISGKDEPFTITAEDVERENWYSALEKRLLETFCAVGPCASIEEQLAVTFAEYVPELCIRACGSVEEFLKRTQKIDFETFGVETRLWRKGEKVPAVGSWNKPYAPESYEKDLLSRPIGIDELPEILVDVFLKDHIYSNCGDFNKTLEKMYPYFYKLPEDKRDAMLLNLKNRHAILRRKYNRFADFEIGELRHKALELYGNVFELLCAIDEAGGNLEDFPQQPLVILSQIYAHISQILELSEADPAAVQSEYGEIALSVEGMEFNFEDICGLLWDVVDNKNKNCFMLVK
ncbi:MAG: hypothetical protein ACTTKL_07140 [Treponema sp.]